VTPQLLQIELMHRIELMHGWGFALREGVFAETKEGIGRNKDKERLLIS